MIEITVPGHRSFRFEHLILDFNGTLACDGHLLAGVKELLQALSSKLAIHVLTADTFGIARTELSGIDCELTVLPEEYQDRGKLEYLRQVGVDCSVCIGNGRNDQLMLKEAVLGIAVILDEAVAYETLLSADVVCTSITSALELFTHPLRLVATLRS
jgi:soluble P-type ATPase